MKSIKALTQLDKIKLFILLGVLLTMIFGSINHFIYEWSGNNMLAGIFFATNESLWEHIKLSLLPMLVIFCVGGFLFSRQVNNYFLAVFCALSFDVFFLAFTFLGYTVFTRKSWLPLDLTIFVSSIIFSYLIAYRIFFLPKRKILSCLAVLGIIFWAAVFLTCTYHAPDFFLFQEMYVDK